MKTMKLFAVIVVLALLSATCSAAVVRVKWDSPYNGPGNDWDHAFHSVQAGINACAAGSEVWVAAGTYVECIDIESYIQNYVTLYGGFAGAETSRDARDWKANETILDGNKAGSVVTAKLINASIDGFTLRNGKYTSACGGGIYCCNNAKLTIRNCTISNNTMATYGGGVYCADSRLTLATSNIQDNSGEYGGGICASGSWISIANSTITRNTSLGSSARGGGCYLWNCSSVTIEGNRIRANEAQYGGGIYSEGSSPIIKDNLFAGNVGGAASCGSGSAVISNNRFAGNVAQFAAIISIANLGKVKNNVIVGNGSWSEIIACFGQVVVSNNTMIGNDSGACGAIYCGSGSPVVANNVIAFNTKGMYKYYSATPNLRNNCLFNEVWDYYSLPPGVGDFRADPRLASVEYGNVHLQPGSPCIDAGDNSVVDTADKDLDGQNRILNTVDIGADESDGTSWPDQPAVVRVSTDGDDGNDGSSWSKAKKTIQAAIEYASLAGGEVWVKAGVYNEAIQLLPYAGLYGGFDGTETERAQRDWRTYQTVIQPSDMVCAVRASGGRESLVVDGFTIRNGESPRGGGIGCFFSSPAIANCSILSNTATPVPGVSLSGLGGGIYCWYSSPSIVNGLIAGNAAAKGGGVYCESSSRPRCTNCTIVNNNASEGGGVYCDSFYSPPPASSIALSNSIIAFNQSGIYARSTTAVRHSNVFGNTAYNRRGGVSAGEGSISVDPMFVNLPGGDYHLSPYSLCIDAGTNEGAPATDFDGIARPVDGDCDGVPTTDIGAFEYVPIHITIDVLPDESPNIFLLQPHRLITVAVLGSSDFDASQVDPLSVEFGPEEATEVHAKGHLEDVNFDGFADMALHFRCGETGIVAGDSTVHLYGRLTNGERIEGSDSVTASAK